MNANNPESAILPSGSPVPSETSGPQVPGPFPQTINLPVTVAPEALPIASKGEGCKTVVGHADRIWRAEENNASRIATRANLVLSGLAAVIGFKLYALGKELDTVWQSGPWWLVVLYFLTAAIAIVLMLISGAWLLGFLGRSPLSPGDMVPLPSSSWYLLSDDDADLMALTDEEAVALVVERTLMAAGDLKSRNTKRQKQVSRAQVFLGFAIVVAILSMALYTCLSWNRTVGHTVQNLDKGSRSHAESQDW